MRGWTGRVAVGVLALAILGVGLGALFGGGGGGGSEGAAEDPVGDRPTSDCPARDHLSPDANGLVREGVRPSFDYTFLFVSETGCRPVGFDPCQPVRYVLNRRLATDEHVADLDRAIAKLGAATGLELHYVGTTEEDPRAVPNPTREADGSFTWPPVVIGWSHLGAGDQLRARSDRGGEDSVVGGGGRPMIVGDVIVTGNLVLNLDAVTDTDTHTPVPHGFGPGVNWGRIILHELAHVIGLGHVESRTSIMNEELTRQTISSSEWGVGDLIGLRQLGRDNGCLTVPTVPTRGSTPR